MTVFPTAAELTGATLTEAQFKTGLNTLLSAIVGLLGSTGEAGASLAALGAPLSSHAAKTAAYTVALADRGRLLGCSGSWTLGLPAVATAGSGFVVALQNTGSGTITIDPASAELIDGAATLALLPGTAALLVCTGSAWVTLGCQPATARLLAQAGSAALPGIAWALDQDTGLFRPAADQIGFATAGVQRALLTSTALQLDVPLTGTAVTQSATDTTAGRVLKVGDGGLLGQAVSYGSGTTWGAPAFTHFIAAPYVSGQPGDKPSGAGMVGLSMASSATRGAQIVIDTTTPGGAGRTYLRTWSGGSPGAWLQLYSQLSVLGSVAQAAGVPTGALIERASNANGEYVRFADGTQICNKTVTASASADVTWTFPAAFVTAVDMFVAASAVSGTDAIFGQCRAPSSTAVAFNVWSTSGTRQALSSRLIAIGRWF